MPIRSLHFKSGVNTLATQAQAVGTWAKSLNIRFRDGFLEKQFGYSSFTQEMLVGVCRQLHPWMTAAKSKFLAAGTHKRLQLFNAGTLYDITPIRAGPSNITVDLSTVSGSATVTVAHTAHGASSNDEVRFGVPVSIGGIILYGYYVVTVVDANTYTVTAAANATATVNNGGAVPTFTTVNTTPNVTVTLNNHGVVQGQAWVVDVSTAVGGLTLVGSYQVSSITSANAFVIIAGINATSSTSASENTSHARYSYLVSPGYASTTALIGWGSGTWGSGTWGNGGAGDVFAALRIWSLDNFQDTLLAAPSDGPLYYFVPPDSGQAAAPAANSPLFMTAMFITTPQLIVVSLGSEVLGSQDPLLVRWTDAGSYTIWTATAANLAGSYRLSRGSKIVSGFQGPQANYIWTDIDFWIMQFIGAPYAFSFSLLATGCGLIARNAAVTLGSSLYWMGNQGFFKFSGAGVEHIPCSVWDTIFQNIDVSNQDKVLARADSATGEVAWTYPSLTGGGENDSDVKYNTQTGEWDYSRSPHVAWVDQNIFGYPIGVHFMGDLHYHDVTFDGAGRAINAMAESGFMTIADGDQMEFVDYVIPDLTLRGSPSPSVKITINTLDYLLGGTLRTFGPFTVTQNTPKIVLRARARFMSLKIESTDIGVWWRLGDIRVRSAPDGRLP